MTSRCADESPISLEMIVPEKDTATSGAIGRVAVEALSSPLNLDQILETYNKKYEDFDFDFEYSEDLTPEELRQLNDYLWHETYDTIGDRERKYIDDFKNGDIEVKDIPDNILDNHLVQEAITQIIKDRLLDAYPDPGEPSEEWCKENCPQLIDSGERKESYLRSCLNSDIDRFLDGEPIIFDKPILELREPMGGVDRTNYLSLEWIQQGKYAESIRYVLRALIGKCIYATGSKGEKTNAAYFAKNIAAILGTNAYPGADASTLGADATYIMSQNFGDDFYASGADKPKGYLGRGFTRKNSEKHADGVDKSIKYILYGWNDKSKGISQKVNREGKPDDYGRPKFADRVNCYSELNNTGKSRIDAIAEFTRTLLKDKALPVVQTFEGADQGYLVNAFQIYKLIAEKNDQKAMAMLTIDDSKEGSTMQDLKEKAGELYYKYVSSNISYYMSDELEEAMAEFVGVPKDKRLKRDKVEVTPHQKKARIIRLKKQDDWPKAA